MTDKSNLFSYLNAANYILALNTAEIRGDVIFLIMVMQSLVGG